MSVSLIIEARGCGQSVPRGAALWAVDRYAFFGLYYAHDSGKTPHIRLVQKEAGVLQKKTARSRSWRQGPPYVGENFLANLRGLGGRQVICIFF